MKPPYKLTNHKLKLKDAYQLLHDGAIALAQAECNGIRVDVDYCQESKAQLEKDLSDIETQFKATKFWAKWVRWQKKVGGKQGFKNDAALRILLYNDLGLKMDRETDAGQKPVDFEAITSFVEQVPELELLLRWRKLDKALSTYFAQILREVRNGVIHPTFHLHLVVTYRSSSSNPNFHNIPVRDKEIQKLVRQAFLPRPGRRIVEVDFSGAEVRVAACYHQDPTMLKYIKDPTTDMHRDMAMDCYILPQGEVEKTIRYAAKNKFVFPAFYGSYWKQISKDLWDAIDQLKLKTTSGVPLRDHLRKKKLRTLDEFAQHIRKVEEDFWGNRFQVYGQWREDIWDLYQKKGRIETLTGFVCRDIAKRNELINRPIQGSAFHCLLWSLIELQKELNQGDWKSLIVGQIHDSIVLDVPEGELMPLLSLVRGIISERLPTAWDWIIVPMEAEAEATGLDESWYHKKPISMEV